MFVLPSQLPFFAGLSDPELVQLIDQLPFRQFPKGLLVLEEGEYSDEIYAILRGGVDVLRRDGENGVTHTVALHEGELFGEFSYFTKCPRTHSVVTREETVLLEISAQWLHQATRSFPELAKRLEDLYRSRTLLRILKSTSLFSSLETSELEAISQRFELRSAQGSDVLIEEGSRGFDLMILKQGQVRVSKREQGQIIELAVLGPGEVFGEMAVITGEPRSASVTALSQVELMLLSQEACRDVFHEFPKVLESIRALIELRALQNQQTLEAFSNQVFESAHALEAQDGLWVKDLGLRAKLRDTSGSEKIFPILRLSPQTCALETDQWFDSAQLSFEEPRQKILKDLSKVPSLTISMQRAELGVMNAVFSDVQAGQVLQAYLPKLAQAKLKGLVYPEYDVNDADLRAALKSKTYQGSVTLVSSSITGGRLRLGSPWPAGDMGHLEVTRGDKVLVSTKVLSMGEHDSVFEFQFDYEHQSQKLDIETFVNELSKGITLVSQASKSTKPLSVPSQSPLLIRRFSSTHEFIRTFLSSIDAGMLKVAHEGSLAVGAAVRLRLVIPAQDQGRGQGHERMISAQGTVKSQKSGVVLVQLDDPQNQLRARLEKLCKDTIEKQSEVSWEDRKNELLGVSPIEAASRLPVPIKWGIIAALAILIVSVYLVTFLLLKDSGVGLESPWPMS